MNQSKVKRERKCKSCGDTFYTTATRLSLHAQLCKRAKAIGIVLPGIVVPK